MSKHTRRAGFTLIELIIYIGIFSIAAGLLTGVLTTFTRVQLRESATTAVSQEAQFVIQTIQRLVTDASLIELTKDVSSSTLKLRMPVAANDPTCIQFSNGTVYLMQGNDDVNKQTCFATSTPQAKALTTSKVVVNSLAFKKSENPPAGDTVKIDLTVSYNSTNPQESAISRTLQTAIAKVSAATFDSDIIPSTDATHNVGIGGQRWATGYFSGSLLVGYTSVTGGIAAFNGNVGIGTGSPGSLLEIRGASPIFTVRPTGAGEISRIRFPNSAGTVIGELAVDTGGNIALTDSLQDSAITFTTKNAGGQSERARITGDGNVGIGTTGPGAKLHVKGGATGEAIHIQTAASPVATTYASRGDLLTFSRNDLPDSYLSKITGSWSAIAADNTINFEVSNAGTLNTVMTLLGNGNVGIGTTGPAGKLDIVQATSNIGLLRLHTNAQVGGQVGIMFAAQTDAPGRERAAIYFEESLGTAHFTGDLVFALNNAGGGAAQVSSADERMRITRTGNVGIGGLTTVTSRLQVAGGDIGLGNATATGNQPVTVWLTNASGVARTAGEIVIIGSSDNSFTTTTTANHFQVLGIVYDSSIGIGAVGRVAIGGVVSVQSQGAVTRGNYLVTSTTAGKATHATSLASGQSALGRWLESLGGASTGRALIRY